MELMKETLKSLSLVIIDPTLALILIILGVVFYIKNRKISVMQKMIAGESINSPLELTVSQICWGIIGGTIVSILLTLLGIVFDKSSGIQVIFIISLFLMLIKPRFVCFSYSGAILGIFSLIITIFYPENGLIKIDIPCLIALIGVLHIVEGLLVIIDGSRGAIPVFTKKDGKIFGGYAMRRYWIIPVALLIALNKIDGSLSLEYSKLTWWPLIGESKEIIKRFALISIPFMGMLSYSSVTFTRTKIRKTIDSGIGIVSYGVILVLISNLANLGLAAKLIVLILLPVGHELMLKYQRISEESNEPLFYSEEGKIKVLEVVPDTSSYLSGIKVNDSIMKINGKDIISEKDIYKLSRKEYGSVVLEVEREKQNIKIELKFEKGRRLGLVLVPILVEDSNKIDLKNKNFKDFLERIKEKQMSDDIKNGINEKEILEKNKLIKKR